MTDAKTKVIAGITWERVSVPESRMEWVCKSPYRWLERGGAGDDWHGFRELADGFVAAHGPTIYAAVRLLLAAEKRVARELLGE